MSWEGEGTEEKFSAIKTKSITVRSALGGVGVGRGHKGHGSRKEAHGRLLEQAR